MALNVSYDARLANGQSISLKQSIPMARLPRLLIRAILLRCPGCGQAKLFRGLFTMHEDCPTCGHPFHRESGFYLGAIYFNYGLTALVITIAYPVLTLTGLVSSRVALIGTLTFAVLFPIVFFRFARSLWLAFDEMIDPQDGKNE